MDFTFSLSSDLFNLLGLPLILLTLKEVIPKWSRIWDKDVTLEDRRMLMRIVIFLALPVVVFVHELGHLLAALQMGVRVYDFHYGPVTGHVNVDANIPPEQSLWIAVAGNLAQVLLGFLCLGLATVIRQTAWVVFLVYLGLFAIGDTVIFYAALSAASVYGDWSNIYQSPCKDLVKEIALVHAGLIGFVIYCMKGSAPRRWFTQKTMPGWYSRHQKALAAVKESPNLETYLALQNSFLDAGLYKEAEDCLNEAEKFAQDSPVIAYAKAELELSRGNTDKGLSIYEGIAHDERVTSSMRAQVLYQMGDIWLFRRDTQRSLNYFDQASKMDPQQGDARLQKAILNASMGDFEGMEDDLKVLREPETNWVFRRNRDSAEKEMEKLEHSLLQVRKR